MAENNGSAGTVVIVVLVGGLAVALYFYLSTKGKNDALTALPGEILGAVSGIGTATASGTAKAVAKSPVASAGKAVNTGISTIQKGLQAIPVVGGLFNSGTYDYATADVTQRFHAGDPLSYSPNAIPRTESAKLYWAQMAAKAAK